MSCKRDVPGARLALILALTLCFGFLTLAAPAPASVPDWSFRELTPAPPLAGPPLPDPTEFNVQLVLDDDSAEGAFGVAGAMARQFLWFQRFTPPVADFDLEEVWVLFPQDPQIAPGAAIQLVVYRDADGDPTNGADLLLAVDETVQVADGGTFSVYPLATPVEVRGGGDVLIGVVNRYVVSGVTPVTQPAALDTDDSQGRSWVATWTGDPPDPPQLPPDQNLFLIDDLVPGNWMIRGFGTTASALEIPTLDPWGLAGLALLLTVLAWRRLRPARLGR